MYVNVGCFTIITDCSCFCSCFLRGRIEKREKMAIFKRRNGVLMLDV
nr:MAG TPA: hypothetical protein [Caudoviricetes sp.]